MDLHQDVLREKLIAPYLHSSHDIPDECMDVYLYYSKIKKELVDIGFHREIGYYALHTVDNFSNIIWNEKLNITVILNYKTIQFQFQTAASEPGFTSNLVFENDDPQKKYHFASPERQIDKSWNYHNLYVLSKDIVQVGDYSLFEGKVVKVLAFTDPNLIVLSYLSGNQIAVHQDNLEYKIIASNNPRLYYKEETEPSFPGSGFDKDFLLPKISDTIVVAYVHSYNAGRIINTCEVESDIFNKCATDSNHNLRILKLII